MGCAWKCKVGMHVWWQRRCFLHQVSWVWSSMSRGHSVVMARLGIVGSCGGGRKLTTDGKEVSLKLPDLSLILNVTFRGTSSFACNVAPLLLALMLTEGQSEGWVVQRHRPPLCHATICDSFYQSFLIPLSSCSQSFLFFFPFNHFLGLYLKCARGKQNRICYWLLVHLFHGSFQGKSY